MIIIFIAVGKNLFVICLYTTDGKENKCTLFLKFGYKSKKAVKVASRTLTDIPFPPTLHHVSPSQMECFKWSSQPRKARGYSLGMIGGPCSSGAMHCRLLYI